MNPEVPEVLSLKNVTGVVTAMSTAYQYRKVSEELSRSLSRFEEVEALLPREAGEEGLDELKNRWKSVLISGEGLAEFVKNRHRAQSPAVLVNLQELSKYADVTRPYRLSIIGQKGVGKSALVNALLGATGLNYTPSEVAGKAVSGTRVRLVATEETAPAWKVVFLTPRRLWEVGCHLLQVARLPVPSAPTDLESREQTLAILSRANEGKGEVEAGLGSSVQIQASSARKTLAQMVEVYRGNSALIPADYLLELDDPDVDGSISPYIRQTPESLYLIVDYVARQVPEEEAGLLAGRKLELEDVLGLDDPRDSFFALEAFRDSFAVVLAFKCDRGLNTESSSLLQYLFSRDEEALARYGSLADLNKAIIVANQFDVVVNGVSVGSHSNPLNGIEDIRRELSKYTRQTVPLYLTSAQLAQMALQVQLDHSVKPSSGYSSYLKGLSNLLAVVSEKGLSPDYLDFIMAKRAEIEGESLLSVEELAGLTLELSGLPRLAKKVEEALEAGSILRGRVANAEYYYARAVAESAMCYARQMQQYGLALEEFNQPVANLESRLFSRFQFEMRQKLDEIDGELGSGYFALSQKYIHGPFPKGAEQIRQGYLDTIKAALMSNRQLIMNQPHIASGETVTDAWRKVFEDINDWLTLEAGRQMKGLVAPLLVELDRLAGELQRKLAALVAGSLDQRFWESYRRRLEQLRQRLLNQAELLAISYYTDNRFSVYDLQIAEALHVGEAGRRREEVIRLLQERVLGWFNNMWHLLTKVSMTELSAFIGEVRYYVLGLNAEGSLLAGLEVTGRSSAELAPADSLIAILNHRYHTDENYRRQYARREPTPSERLAEEIREWAGLVQPPTEGMLALSNAVAQVGVAKAEEPLPVEMEEEEEQVEVSSVPSSVTSVSSYTRLRVPVESRHPYNGITRQVWEITNPDTKATHTRVHFRRVELTGAQDKILLESFGKREQQVITGQAQDFWSEVFNGRVVKLHFISENPGKTGWGFMLDGVDSPASLAVIQEY